MKPENTLPAFETALDLGVSTLEFDLHHSADGEIVVWHDAILDAGKCGLDPTALEDTPDPDDRTTSDEELMVRSLDSAQLATYRCDRNPDPGRFPDQSAEATDLAGDDYSILTLEELLDSVTGYSESPEKTDEQRENASEVRFDIETKRKPKNPENIDDGFDGVHAGPFELRILEIVAHVSSKPVSLFKVSITDHCGPSTIRIQKSSFLCSPKVDRSTSLISQSEVLRFGPLAMKI